MTQFTCKGVKQINNRISLNMTFIFTIRISRRFSSAREFQMGNFQKYWSQNVGQDFIVLDFFHGGRFWKLTEGTLKIGRKMLPPEGSHVCVCDLVSSTVRKIYSFNLLQNVHGRISFDRNQKPFCVNPQIIIEKLFPNNGEKILDSNVKLRKWSGLSLLLDFS